MFKSTILAIGQLVINMGFGKKISASTMFAILGVVLATTIVVSAFAVLIGSTTLNKSVSDNDLTVSTSAFSTGTYADLVAETTPKVNTFYDFQVSFTPTNAEPSGYYEFVFSGTGVLSASSVNMQYYDGTSWVDIAAGTFVSGTPNTLTIIYTPIGGFLSGENVEEFAIQYTNSGEFDLTINIQKDQAA